MTTAASTGPEVADAPVTAPNRLGYRPGLDGIRGVGMVFVLLYHGGITWFPGSFLGVSMFFTLSGFLITRLMMEERVTTGGVGIRQFYGRRIRRLLPVAAAVLAGIIVAARLGAFPGVAQLRRDLVGTALQLANWTRLTSPRSYHDLFLDGVSPVEHWWSLAIEEQAYLLWPLLFLVAARRGPAPLRRRVIGLYVVTTVIAVGIAFCWGPNAAYLATPARIPEVVAGGVLAVLLDLRRPPRWLSTAGLTAAVAMLVLIVVTPFDHGWAYEGGLPFFGLLSAVAIGGAVVDGPLQRFLTWRPAVVLGRLAYVAYLVHWPVYVYLDRRFPDWSTAPAFALKLAVTAAIVVPLHRFVEQPIRIRPLSNRTIPLGLGVLAGLAVLAAVLTPAAPGRAAAERPERMAAVDLQPLRDRPGPLTDTDGTQLRPVRVIVVGDSTGRDFGAGLVDVAYERPELLQVRMAALDGCGLVAGGKTDNLADFTRADCDRRMHDELPDLLTTLRPDVIVMSIAGADTFPRRWDDGPLRPATDPDFSRRIRDAYDQFFDEVAAVDATVVWIRPAVPDDPEDHSHTDGSQSYVESVITDQERRHPGLVRIIDFRTWFEAEGLDRESVRPDGVHIVFDVVADIVDRFLLDEILAAVDVATG